MQSTSSAALAALKDTRFESYWLDSLGSVSEQPALCENIECDLMIVGGGFSGLWAAVQALEANPDRDVVLIESAAIANGASGRPAAIMSTSVMHGIDNTQRVFPDEVEELERLGIENMQAFKHAIETYKIDCDVEWTGEMIVSIGQHGIPTIERELKLYNSYGHDASLLSKSEIQQQIHSPIFDAAVWSKKLSGTVHPGKLAQGLKRVCIQLGVRLFENTPHISNVYRANKIHVKTPNAMIVANKVLLATNAFAVGNWRIRTRVSAIRDRIVVTEPLSSRQLASIGWHNRQGVYDTRTQLNYMRLTRDNRILFGGRLDYFFADNTDPAHDKTPAPYLRLVESFYRTFPQLKQSIRFSHAWSGPIGLTTRMAVHYQTYHDGNMVFAGGYSGFGVTATRFGSRVGLAILDRDDIPETRMSFATTQPNYIPPEPFRWIGAKLTMYALDTLDEKGGWRKPWIRLVEKMGFPVTL